MCVSDDVFLCVSVLLALSCGVNMWHLWRHARCPVVARHYHVDELIYHFQQSSGNPAVPAEPEPVATSQATPAAPLSHAIYSIELTTLTKM